MDQSPDVAPPFHQTARNLKLGKAGILSEENKPISHYATLFIENFHQNNALC